MQKPFMTATLVAAAAGAAAEPVTFAVDPGHTVVTFEALHFNTSTNRMRVQAKEGKVVLDRAARSGSVDVTLDLGTLSAASPVLESTLKGERAFNVALNPTARFIGDVLAFDGDKLASVAGTLTILGRSQPAKLTATRFNCYENPQIKREVCGGDFEATIRRAPFGLGFAPSVAPDEVRLLVQVEATRQ